MKKIIVVVLAVFFLSIFTVSNLAYSKPLTEFEMEVHNTVERKNAEENLSVLDENYEEKRDKIYMEVAGMYGIDYARVVDIMFNYDINEMLAEEDY